MAIPNSIDRRTSPVVIAWIVLALAWLSAGMFDREPWKADEAYTFGMVLTMVDGGSLVVPTLGGEPFLEKPPLVFWLAAGTAKALAPIMPLHAGARLANVLLSLATFLFTWLAARLAFGGPARSAPASAAADGRSSGVLATGGAAMDCDRRAIDAVLILAGCPTWLLASRYLTADLGLVMAAAVVAYALVNLQQQRRWAGAWLGIATAAGLLSKGLLFPGVVVLCMLVLITTAVPFRNRYAIGQYGWAVAIGLVASSIWPALLAKESPQLLHTWLWDNNVGRFLGLNALGPDNNRLALAGQVVLFLLPALPLAVAALVRQGRGWRHSTLYPPAVFCGTWIAAVLMSSTARIIYILPMLAPLALVAAGFTARWAEQRRIAWTRAVLIAAALLAVAAIVTKLVLFWRDPLSRWGSAASVAPGELALAGAAAVALLILIRSAIAGRPAAIWAGGLTFAWVLALALFLRPADQTTGFKALFTELGRAVPAGAPCIASRALGESERGLLEYYARLRTVRAEVDPTAMVRCPLRIEQERTVDRGRLGCGNLNQIWSGSRPEDRSNLFRLCDAPGLP